MAPKENANANTGSPLITPYCGLHILTHAKLYRKTFSHIFKTQGDIKTCYRLKTTGGCFDWNILNY